MKQLTIEQKLFLLAYAGLPSFVEFFKKNEELIPKDRGVRAVCIYLISTKLLDLRKSYQFADTDFDPIFKNPEIIAFFDSLVTSDEDDPKEIALISNLVGEFHRFTDSEMERYADFEPFLLFEHEAWLQLIIRIQKSSSVNAVLKTFVNAFIKEGFGLILHPSLDEFSDPLDFFPWFEKLEFPDKEKVVHNAMAIWKEHEEQSSYNLSGDYSEKWYKAALAFAIRITSKECVSRVFAETFKEEYPEVYKKFRLLAELDEYEIPAPPNATAEKKQKDIDQDILKMLMKNYNSTKELVDLISKDTRIEDVSRLIFTIATDASADGYKSMRKTLGLLIELFPEHEITKKLISMFTQYVEKKIEEDTLTYSDVPPSALYISDKDLHWLF